MAVLTLGELLRERAAATPAADLLVFPDTRTGYGQLFDRAMRWAQAFVALDIQPGEHIGILLNTGPDFVEILFGIAMAGAVAAPINARYQPNEIAYLADNADLVAIVSASRRDNGADFAERISSALPSIAETKAGPRLHCREAPRLRHALLIGDDCPPGFLPAGQALAAGSAIGEGPIRQRIDSVSPDDIALILYTSGTTSNPKGCLIAHRGIVGNGRDLASRYRLGPQDRFWSPLPIFHIAGILPLIAILDAGGAYLTLSYFEPGVALEMLEREGATCAYPCFVTIMQDLIGHPRFAETDLSRVRLMNSSFALQPDWIRDAMQTAMPQAVQVGTYGLTEAAGTICTSRIDDPYELRVGRLGAPLDGWRVRIVDPETGAECPVDTQGEILALGPAMLRGYYKDARKTAETIDQDGWMHTGDLGSLDAFGQIMFHGRLKDMLKVGGENVAAAEIEAVLGGHPAVHLAQVVGIPDPRYVEVPAAFIQLAQGATVDAEALTQFCKGKIAGFKIPRYIRFVTEWPMSTSKVQKFKLRDQLRIELGQI
jgi:acyl-CoA synthetase (AMP-forming)/AMP-acid ligase II